MTCSPNPSNARLLVRAYSPDLVEVIRDINKYSNNTMAKQLFLSIGARFRTPAMPMMPPRARYQRFFCQKKFSPMV